MSRVSVMAMEHHTWYLGEELVALASFDSLVPSETKREMAVAIETVVEGYTLEKPQLLDPASTSRPHNSQKQGLLQHFGSVSGLDGEGTTGMGGKSIVPGCQEECICSCVGQ